MSINRILELKLITASRKISVVITLRVCCDHSDDLFPPIRIVNAKIFKGEVTENCADRSVYKRRKAFQSGFSLKASTINSTKNAYTPVIKIEQ